MHWTVAARTISSAPRGNGTWPLWPRPLTPSAYEVVSAGGTARGAANSAGESSKRAPEINNQLSFEGRKACLMSILSMSSVVKSV